jgi:hypothetical protein
MANTNFSFSIPIRAKSPVENMGASAPAPEQVNLTIRGTRHSQSPTPETSKKAPRVDALSVGTTRPRPDEAAAAAPVDDQPAEPAQAAGERKPGHFATKKHEWLRAIKENWKGDIGCDGDRLVPSRIAPGAPGKLPAEQWSARLLEQLFELSKMAAGDGQMARSRLIKAVHRWSLWSDRPKGTALMSLDRAICPSPAAERRGLQGP